MAGAATQFPKEQVVQLIRDEAERLGISPDYAVKVAEIESQFTPRKKSTSKNSTAYGLFQLNNDARKQLKLDPIASRDVPLEEEIRQGLDFIKFTEQDMARRLGRAPEYYEQYLGHYKGGKGAMRLLNADPQAKMEKVFPPGVIKSNPTLRGKTVGQHWGDLKDKFKGMPPKEGFVPPNPMRPTPQQLEREVGPPIDESQPDWEMIGRGQMTAQAPTDEPLMMADGGQVLGQMMDPSSPVVMAADGGDIGEKLSQMIENARTDDHFRQINEMISAHYPRHRASGSPPEGEVSDEPTAEELEAASKPSFRTSAAGGGRKRGNITQALESGTAAREMLKGMTMLPQNLAGIPVDVAAMALRPFGYNVEKPVMGSDWLKEKSRQAGLAYAPSGNEAERGFFAAGDILSGLVNPAAPVRGAVAAAGKTGEAAKMLAKDFQAYNRALGPAGASYAVRPTGSVMAIDRIEGKPSGVSNYLQSARQDVGSDLREVFPIRDRVYDPQTGEYTYHHVEGKLGPLSQKDLEEKAKVIQNFWDTKAKNYFTKQFGTPDDPIVEAIAKKRIRSSLLEEDFPDYLLRGLYEGTTRKTPEGQERFFPKDTRAWEDFTRRYDRATGIAGDVVLPGPGMGDPDWTYLLGSKGKAALENAKQAEMDKIFAQGLPAYRINPQMGAVFRSAKDPELISKTGIPDDPTTSRAKELFKAFEERQAGMHTPDVQVFNQLPETIARAVEQGQPVYDFSLAPPLKQLFDSEPINRYLASIPTQEAAKMRFEDVVKNAVKMNENKLGLEALDAKIRKGQSVPQKVFDEGLSAPLLSFPENSPFKGYTWKRIEDRKATVPEGAYIGHSVGGYEKGGPGYSLEKRRGFLTGEYQIYTLRDSRNRPVTTIEATQLPEGGLEVQQIRGDGRATGNTAPVQHEEAVLSFLQNQLKPVSIKEKDEFLTPAMQLYKERVNNPAPVAPPAEAPPQPQAAVPDNQAWLQQQFADIRRRLQEP